MPLARSFVTDVYRGLPPPSSIVQSATHDPTPSGQGCFNTNNPDGTLGLAFAAFVGSNTTNGATLFCFAHVANDQGNTVVGVSDPVNGAWDFVNSQTNADPTCNTFVGAWTKRNAQPLIAANSWVGTASASSGTLTLGSGSGTFRLGQQLANASIPVPNSQGSGVLYPTALLSGTLGASGSTYSLNANVGFSSQATSTYDFVLCQTHSTIAFVDFDCAYIAELSNTDNSSVYSSGNNDAPSGAGTDNLSSGTIAAPSSPGMVLAFCINGALNNSAGAPPTFAPNAGSGFGNSFQMLTTESSPIVTVEWQHFPSVGHRAATFSGLHASVFDTLGVAFLDAA